MYCFTDLRFSFHRKPNHTTIIQVESDCSSSSLCFPCNDLCLFSFYVYVFRRYNIAGRFVFFGTFTADLGQADWPRALRCRSRPAESPGLHCGMCSPPLTPSDAPVTSPA